MTDIDLKRERYRRECSRLGSSRARVSSQTHKNEKGREYLHGVSQHMYSN